MCMYIYSSHFQDELDAAGRVVQSRADIRSILQEHEASHASKVFGKATVSAVGVSDNANMEYEGVHKDGTAMLMNIEINKEASIEAAKHASNKPSGAKSKAVKGNKDKDKGQQNSGAKPKGKSTAK